MLSKEEDKKISGPNQPDSTIKYNVFQNELNIDPSSQIYKFCQLKSEINTQNENGWTPIYRAIIANNLEALYELLKMGADPNITNNLGETPLYLSVDINNYDALIILLQYKADCNIAKKNGNTPLHLATKRNKISFISALLRNDANPNIVNKLYSQTATHLAIINKVDECTLNEFNACKADIYNIKDKYDKTPFDYVKDVGDQNYMNLLIKIFGKDSNKNNFRANKRTTWDGFIPNEIEDNTETTPVKINYADRNNSNFVSLSKNVFISFDENDIYKNNGTVVINNINTNDEHKNLTYNTNSNKSESQNNKENIDINKNSVEKVRNTSNKKESKINIDIDIYNTEPIKNKKLDVNEMNQNNNNNNTKKKEENKNTISDTVKKLNMSDNSELTSNFNFSTPLENNYSISYQNSKINQNNDNSGINSNLFNFENRMSSIMSNNSKRNNNSIPTSHSQTRKDINEMNPLEMINQVITTSNNSNIFSELQINSMINKNTISDEDNKTIQDNISNINNNILLNDSLEYSKSKSHIIMEQTNKKQKEEINSNNKNEYIDIENINGLNITINEYEDNNKNNDNIKSNNQHRQLSYHNKPTNNNNNNKENVMPNLNISKRNSNTSSNSFNNKKMTIRNSTIQNELLTTVPSSFIQGENNSSSNANVLFKQKLYKNNPTQPEYQKEKMSKDLLIGDSYQNNIKNYNTYDTFKQNQNLKNSRMHNNKSTLSGPPNINNFIYSFSNNSYSNMNNKTNKFPSLKLSEIENVNYNNNSFLSRNMINKSEELNLCSPQNIPNELLTRLREWLISCDLLCYYNLLIKNDIYDIDLYIHNLKNNKINISYKDIEDIGIKKPGHIFRFLLKLQIDTGILDSQIYNSLTNKFNSNILTTIGLTASTNIIKCCGITLFKQNGNGEKTICNNNNICCDASSSSINNNYNYNDIFGFLKYKGLLEYKENFIHNGFDQIDFIFIQLFSNFKFNKEIINDYMHIYAENDKKIVLQKLYEEKKRIALELGLNYDINEEEKILNTENDNNHNSNDFDISCSIF